LSGKNGTRTPRLIEVNAIEPGPMFLSVPIEPTTLQDLAAIVGFLLPPHMSGNRACPNDRRESQARSLFRAAAIRRKRNTGRSQQR
jgi:hypothetical protein